MEKSGFVWYEHMTTNLEEATAFYSEVVGWQMQDSGMPGMPYVLFGKGSTQVGGMTSSSSFNLSSRFRGWGDSA